MKSAAPSLKWIFTSIFGCFIFLIILPILLVLLIISGVISITISLLIKLKYGDKVTRAAGPDSIYGKSMAESLPYINTITRLDGQPCLPEIINTFNKDILEARNEKGQKLYGKLTQLFDKRLGYYIWKECKDFDVNKHFRLVTMEDIIEQEDILCNDSESNINNNDTNFINLSKNRKINWERVVSIFMNKYGTTPMDVRFPQWSFTILIMDSESFMILFRLHHSVSDGINLSRFILEAMLKTKIQVPITIKKDTKIIKFFKMLVSLTHLPYEIVNLFTTRLNRNPLHGPTLSGKKTYLVSNVLWLKNLREMKKKAKTTVNIILLTGISKAIANHFDRKDVKVKTISVLMPSAKQNMEKPITLRNQFDLRKFLLPASIQFNNKKKGFKQIPDNQNSPSDLMKRLMVVKSHFDVATMRVGQVPLNWLGRTFSFLLPACLSDYFFTAEGITVCFSNVPGPQVEISYWGGVQRDLIFWVPDRSPMGIGISIMSYNGRIRVCLSVDENLIDNRTEVQSLLDDFEQCLKELQEELCLQHNDYCSSQELMLTI